MFSTRIGLACWLGRGESKSLCCVSPRLACLVVILRHDEARRVLAVTMSSNYNNSYQNVTEQVVFDAYKRKGGHRRKYVTPNKVSYLYYFCRFVCLSCWPVSRGLLGVSREGLRFPRRGGGFV